MMNTNGGSTAKKKRNVDRISLLPDSLIHHIFSFILAQQAVQTCVLSKRWKRVWTQMTTINFEMDNYRAQLQNSSSIETSLKHLVIGVLSQLSGTSLKKLSYISRDGEDDDIYLVELLICYARHHMVRELCIDVADSDGIDWEFCLAECKSLRVMKISCWFEAEWESLMLPSLKTLEIDCGWESHTNGIAEFKGNIVSGCPKLKSLILHNYLFKDFAICAPKLEYLEIGSSNIDLHILRLDLATPYLKCVKFNNVLAAVESNSKLNFLRKVDFVIHQDCDPYLNFPPELFGSVPKLFQAFRDADSLTFPMELFMLVLPLPPSDLYNFKFSRLTYLKLTTKLEKNRMIEVPFNLLPSFPSLTTYVVHVE